MVRLAIVISVFASACLGTIESSGNDDRIDPPPPPTDVRIKVHDSAGPLSGLAVVFLDASDTVVADVVTDAEGAAVTKLGTGSVTVIRPADPQTPGSAGALYTYVGVKAGDVLDLALPALRPSAPVTVTVTVPLTEDLSAVEITTPCGSGAGAPPTIAVTLDGCAGETDFYVTEVGV